MANTNNKVIFVEPRGSQANVFAEFMKLPLLGTLYLGTLLKAKGFDVRIYNENILGRDLCPDDLDADVLCLSLITTSAERGFAIARDFKEKRPRSRVIIGGVHPTFCAEEAAQYADHVVIGEGANVIEDLVRYGSNEKFIHGTPTKNLDDLPLPDLDLLALNRPMRKTPILTSLGCPFHCTFCSVTQMFGHKYRVSSLERTLEELRRVRTPSVFFYDDNLAADRKRLHAICDRMLAENIKFRWTAQARSDIAKDRDLIKKMQMSGCVNIYIGFESVNPETLINYKKRQSVEEIEEAIRSFQENGISIHGMFVLGSDSDDLAVFPATRKFCHDQRLNSVQFLILTPFPGTEIFRQMKSEGRLLHSRWSYYDGMHTVFKPKHMSALQLQEGMIKSFREFYSFMGATNDALGVVAERARGFVTSRPIRKGLSSFENALIKVVGRTVVRRWLRLNKSYLKYLRSLEGKDAPLQDPV